MPRTATSTFTQLLSSDVSVETCIQVYMSPGSEGYVPVSRAETELIFLPSSLPFCEPHRMYTFFSPEWSKLSRETRPRGHTATCCRQYIGSVSHWPRALGPRTFIQPPVCNHRQRSGAVWKSKRPSRAFRPKEPYAFRGLIFLRHWSQFVPNTLTDIRGHEALHQQQQQPQTPRYTCCGIYLL